MRKIILIFTVFTFTCLSSKCLAQKVLANQNIGGVAYLAVIDNGTLPLGTIKTPSELSSQKTNGRINRHTQNSEINKKVSRRFAVAKADLSRRMSWAEASGWDVSANNNSSGTTTANTSCPTYSELNGETDKGKWRLPTQRELMLIYQMRSELKVITGFSAFKSSSMQKYWSSTESDGSINASSGYFASSYFVDFSSGFVENTGKSYDNYVRCIRDL